MRKAFTLVELMVVVIIVGVIAGFFLLSALEGMRPSVKKGFGGGSFFGLSIPLKSLGVF